MRSVELDHAVARLHRPARRGRERGDRAFDLALVHRARRREAIEGDRARRHGLPARLRRPDLPWRAAARLAAGMGQLDGRHGTDGSDRRSQARVRPDVLITPDPEIARRDPPLRRHRGCLGHHQRSAGHRTRDEMGQMPVRRLAVLGAAVLAHGRDADPVSEADASQGQRTEEVGHAGDSGSAAHAGREVLRQDMAPGARRKNAGASRATTGRGLPPPDGCREHVMNESRRTAGLRERSDTVRRRRFKSLI